jgi:hypothetical protein
VRGRERREERERERRERERESKIYSKRKKSSKYLKKNIVFKMIALSRILNN